MHNSAGIKLPKTEQLSQDDYWDTSWLRKKYPNRFDELYLLEELGDDIFDQALFPNRLDEVEL